MIGLVTAVLAAEWWATGALQLPHRPVVAGLLAVLATLALGSLWGIARARRQRETPQDDPSHWRDGATVRVEGLLQAATSPVLAPFSGQAAVYLEYEARPSVARSEVEASWRARWNGLVATPAVLQTAAGALALRGMPRVRQWPRQVFQGEPHHASAARHLAATRWDAAPELSTLVRPGPLDAWPQPGPDGAAQMHLMNRAALDALGVENGRYVEASLRERLAQRSWMYVEQLLPPGARVTAVGTYRASPRCIDVGHSLLQPDHGVHLGTAASVADGSWRWTLAFAGVLMVVATAAHLLVYLDGGAHLRSLLQTLEGME